MGQVGIVLAVLGVLFSLCLCRRFMLFGRYGRSSERRGCGLLRAVFGFRRAPRRGGLSEAMPPSRRRSSPDYGDDSDEEAAMRPSRPPIVVLQPGGGADVCTAKPDEDASNVRGGSAEGAKRAPASSANSRELSMLLQWLRTRWPEPESEASGDVELAAVAHAAAPAATAGMAASPPASAAQSGAAAAAADSRTQPLHEAERSGDGLQEPDVELGQPEPEGGGGQQVQQQPSAAGAAASVGSGAEHTVNAAAAARLDRVVQEAGVRRRGAEPPALARVSLTRQEAEAMLARGRLTSAEAAAAVRALGATGLSAASLAGSGRRRQRRIPAPIYDLDLTAELAGTEERSMSEEQVAVSEGAEQAGRD